MSVCLGSMWQGAKMANGRGWSAVYGALAAGQCVIGTAAQIANEVHHFNIPSEDAREAIQDFGVQGRVNILVDGGVIAGKRFGEVSGALSVDEGLRRLLAGSGLEFVFRDNRAVNIVAATTVRQSAETPSTLFEP